MASTTSFFYMCDGVEVGPLTQTQLVAAASDGTIQPLTPIRNDIDGEWVRASRVKGLFNALHGGNAAESKQPDPQSRSAASSSSGETRTPTKQCPFCAEQILAAAVKCRFCHEFLDKTSGGNGQNTLRDAAPEQFRSQHDPGLAAVSGFLVPGLGQVYNGQIFQGVAVLGLCGVIYSVALQAQINGRVFGFFFAGLFHLIAAIIAFHSPPPRSNANSV